jgi:hypothetical protein
VEVIAGKSKGSPLRNSTAEEKAAFAEKIGRRVGIVNSLAAGRRREGLN